MKTNDGVTKWLSTAGLVGTHVAGWVGTCCGVGFYIYNNNYALVGPIQLSHRRPTFVLYTCPLGW